MKLKLLLTLSLAVLTLLASCTAPGPAPSPVPSTAAAPATAPATAPAAASAAPATATAAATPAKGSPTPAPAGAATVAAPASAATTTAAPRPAAPPIEQFLPEARPVGQWNDNPSIRTNAPLFTYATRGGRPTLWKYQVAGNGGQPATIDILQTTVPTDPHTYATDLIQYETATLTDCAGPDTVTAGGNVLGVSCYDQARRSVDILVGYNGPKIITIALTNGDTAGTTAAQVLDLLNHMLAG